MKAVIMAAGEGSRMRRSLGSSSLPKPLAPLLGIPLVERVIQAARRAGIDEFIVVLGHRGEEIERHLGNGESLGTKIQYAYNDQWRRGNAYSLLAARTLLEPGERFFLLMGDHIFEPALLRAFRAYVSDLVAKYSCPDDSSTPHFLAVEMPPPPGLDLEEATKVLTSGDNITGLGKKLKQFNGVDAGFFNFHYSIFPILAQEIEKSNGSLSGALQPLIREGTLKVFPFQEYLWHDIDNHADLEQAQRRLLKSLVPKKDGAVSRYLNRRLSLAITARLSSLPVSPNTISLLSFLFCLASALLFTLGRPAAAGLIAQLASVLDGVDGEVARLKFQESLFGAYFDALLDRYADAILIGGIVAGSLLTKAGSPPAILLAGFFALSAAPFSMLAKEKFANLTGKEYIPLEKEGYLSYLPFNRDGRMAIIMIGGLISQWLLTLIVLAVLCNLQVIIRLFIARKHLAPESNSCPSP